MYHIQVNWMYISRVRGVGHFCHPSPNQNVVVTIFFVNCYLPVLWSTLVSCWEDSLSNSMLIPNPWIYFFIFDLKFSGSLIIKLSLSLPNCSVGFEELTFWFLCNTLACSATLLWTVLRDRKDINSLVSSHSIRYVQHKTFSVSLVNERFIIFTRTLLSTFVTFFSELQNGNDISIRAFTWYGFFWSLQQMVSCC